MKMVWKTAAACAAMIGAGSVANAATLVVDVTGAQSFHAFGSAGNQVQTYNIGAGSEVTAVAYNVTITARSPSYLSEANLAFTGSDTNGDGVFLSPGYDVDSSGTGTFVDSANLDDLGLSFAVGSDGILRLEYFESFDDSSVNPDAVWNRGTVTFTYTPVAAPAAVPEPASWAMLIAGFGLVGGTMRRRQSGLATA